MMTVFFPRGRPLLWLAPALLPAMALGQPVTAEGDIFNLSLAELAQVEISIATGNSTPLDRAPASASVINAADIRAMGARHLDEVLETIPGLHVSLSSLSRLEPVYSIRGIHTGFNPHVLLLLNGVPVQSSLQGGRPTLFRLPVTSIERVEVIRGPGSAIYGADAYSGVINVITKDAAAIDATRMGGGTGSFGARELWLETAGRWGDIGLALDMTYQTSNGDSGRRVDADLQSIFDFYTGTQASLAPGALATRYELLDSHMALNSERWQLNLWNWLSRDAGLGAGGAQALDAKGWQDGNVWLADYSYRFNSDPQGWDNSLSLSYLYYDQEVWFNLFPAGALLPIGDDGNLDFGSTNLISFPDGYIGNPGGLTEETKIDYIASYSGWDNHRLRLAVGVRRQSLDSSERKNYGPGVILGDPDMVDGTLVDVSNGPYVFIASSSRNIRYLSLQDEWRLSPNLELTTGVRYDDYSDFGGTTNPRVALVWSVNQSFTSKLMYGSAFRAPAFSELGYKNNPVSLGNSSLKPEQIDTLELAFNYRHSQQLQTTLTLFGYQAEDMIEFVQDPGAPTRTARNARDQKGNGLEWELHWNPLPSWRLNLGYAWQDARDQASNQSIADAPGQLLQLSSSWEFAPQWLVYGQVKWVADRERLATDSRTPIDDYTLANLRLSREQLLPNLDLALSLRNIADADAREPSSGEIPGDYPLEGRSVWLELNYRLN